MLTYKSTRGGVKNITAAEAILKGIADDGGLYVPEYIPKMNFSLEDMKEMDYKTLAYEVMQSFFPDFSEKDLKACIQGAYDDKFDTPTIAPVEQAGELQFLELFHGPTLAFKDMALSVLPYLMMSSAKQLKLEEEVVILTATSGDTGKAALEGFADVKGTKIIVFFPNDGVSEIQKYQMITQTGDNTCVIRIKGNFDDAQNGVKEILGDLDFKKELGDRGYVFSSANSINIGRLVPQIVYYFYAYGQLMNKGKVAAGDGMNVVVPTGNFGNILAAYYAKQMGLPIEKLICASNNNKVLYDFLQDGHYDRNRKFHTTISPSMDILISSNLERLLYNVANNDSAKTQELMGQLQSEGQYQINEDMKNNLSAFYGGYASDDQTQQAIKKVYDTSNYLMDTHTAVAYSVYDQYQQETSDQRPAIIVSTASPYKFPASVLDALDPEKYKVDNEFDLLVQMKDLLGGEIPAGIDGLEHREIVHDTICEVEEMPKVIREFLGLV